MILRGVVLSVWTKIIDVWIPMAVCVYVSPAHVPLKGGARNKE
jgi:hypothetical protein